MYQISIVFHVHVGVTTSELIVALLNEHDIKKIILI